MFLCFLGITSFLLSELQAGARCPVCDKTVKPRRSWKRRSTNGRMGDALDAAPHVHSDDDGVEEVTGVAGVGMLLPVGGSTATGSDGTGTGPGQGQGPGGAQVDTPVRPEALRRWDHLRKGHQVLARYRCSCNDAMPVHWPGCTSPPPSPPAPRCAGTLAVRARLPGR